MTGRKRSLRAMSKEGESVGARRRSARLIKMEEAASTSEEFQILKLKREMKDLMISRREEGRRARRALGFMDRTGPAEEEVLPAEGEAGTGNEKRKKVIKKEVPPELIDYYILNPHNPFHDSRDNLGKRPQWLLECYVQSKALADKVLEYQQALIKQFRATGHTYDYMEVEIDDENN